jgi:hypothetical protein
VGLKTSDPKLRGLIDAAAAFVGLPVWHYRGIEYGPGEWLEGQVLTESAGNPRARRYEPHQDREQRAALHPAREFDVRLAFHGSPDPDTPGVDDGDLEDDASYGLMQVMGYNIRRLVGAPAGTPLSFGFAYRPILNLSLGLSVLLGELNAARQQHPTETESQHVERALARYNGGPTGDAPIAPHGDLRLRAYVDRVARFAELVQQDRRRA